MGLDEKIKIRQMRELNNRKGIFLDLTYIDMVKDINTAVLLSQLVYWFSSDVHGKTKLRVVKEGKLWLVKSKNEWYLETRLSKKQLERAEKILKELGIIEIKTWKFKNIPTNHYYFKWDNFIQLEENILLKGINNIKKGKCIDTKSADITNFNGMNRNGSISSFGMTQKVASLRNDPKGSNGDEPKGSIPWDDPKGGNPITYNTQENTNT